MIQMRKEYNKQKIKKRDKNALKKGREKIMCGTMVYCFGQVNNTSYY